MKVCENDALRNELGNGQAGIAKQPSRRVPECHWIRCAVNYVTVPQTFVVLGTFSCPTLKVISLPRFSVAS